jgi:hypothetical protein
MMKHVFNRKLSLHWLLVNLTFSICLMIFFVHSDAVMTLSDEDVSDSDDDMISCHICLLRFNTTDRKPKYLDCNMSYKSLLNFKANCSVSV